jgi:acid phosphatase (class A)
VRRPSALPTREAIHRYAMQCVYAALMRLPVVSRLWVAALVIATVSVSAFAQNASSVVVGAAVQKAQPYELSPPVADLVHIIPPPPRGGSAAEKAELAELHRVESTRTDAQVQAAKDDEENESLFLYSTVLGLGFDPKALPVTAALGARVKAEQSAAGSALKLEFARVRPYAADKSLHPVCALTDKPNSYPSGHALTGYLEGLTLAELLPARRDAILARADEYAHNRMVCGVHYPSDIEASRRVAYAVFGEMLAAPEFQHDLAAAREELHAHADLMQK